MAARKSAKRKKTVTIEVDVAVLVKLAAASEALSEAAAGLVIATDDPKLAKVKKKLARRR